MLRTVAWMPILLAATAFFGLLGTGAGLLDRSGRKARDVSGWWGRFVLWALGVEVEVAGTANVPVGPAVYAANHGSTLDIPILFAHLPADFRIIHKRSILLVPFVGMFLKVGGHVAIDRKDAFAARRSLDKAIRRIRGGLSVVVFPEGTRSGTGEVLPFKRGSFVLAIDAGVPVVPVSLAGVKALAPRGVLTMRSGRVRLVVHPAIPTAGRAGGDAGRLAEEVKAIVENGCAAA
jgi:1-acyl-sn-glycerol-3-phosphate acyltransferase